MDIRVYRVGDPVKFFRELKNPHNMGEGEKVQIASTLKKEPLMRAQLGITDEQWEAINK